MKPKNQSIKYSDAAPNMSARVQDLAAPPPVATATMLRTQVYLTEQEHRFLQSESTKTGETMAALIRRFIDERMQIPADAWTNNPLLEPTVDDPDAQHLPEDGSINLDHYVYGSPKRYRKVRGKWVPIQRAK
jgi:hypothetical protein